MLASLPSQTNGTLSVETGMRMLLLVDSVRLYTVVVDGVRHGDGDDDDVDEVG